MKASVPTGHILRTKAYKMKLRFIASILIFISAYSPLSIIFLIQDFDTHNMTLKHPVLIWQIIGVSLLSCIIVWAAVYFIKGSRPPVTIKKVSNRSGELINYSIPYMISFFVMDLGNTKLLLSFLFFMIIMFVITLKTHNIFVNPILACMGYNLYDVTYERDGNECEDFFLIKTKGQRLTNGESCRIVELSEQLYLVTERNPEV